jgi:hypothetical protein
MMGGTEKEQVLSVKDKLPFPSNFIEGKGNIVRALLILIVCK